MKYLLILSVTLSLVLENWGVPCSGRFGICHWINIARNKPATQSSTLPQINPYCTTKACPVNTADVAVDGNTSHMYNDGSCTHTGLPPSGTESWSVNVGSGHLIHYIELYLVANPNNRKRLNPVFEVYVDDKLCFSYNSTIPVTKIHDISCTTPILGSNVSIRLPPSDRNRILNLCEVEIYECDSDYFDPVTECTKQCNCREKDEVCDKEDGICNSGCPDGFYEEAGCQRGCDNGWYGFNCSDTCGKCKFDIPCDKSSGFCPGACQTHWKGQKCDECMDNWWGEDCKSQCGQCLNGASCNKSNGICSEGCDPNWTGEKCDVCVDGKWGADCSNECGHCEEGTCDKVDGTCKCLINWEPPFCTDCVNGFYDESCSSACGKCKNGAPCNSTTGICIDGCEPNWLEDMCQECVEGMFGETCSNKCSCKNKSEVCHKVSGSCKSGCIDGKKLPNCLDDCTGGSYGANCSSVCGRCKGGQACDKVSGNCKNGCVKNYQGNKCKECIDGHYGRNCEFTCGHCKNNDICDKRTGNCPHGCVIGFKEGQCIQACEDGTHGEGCLKTCGNCAGNDVCNKTSGACPQKCKEGWETTFCNKKKPIAARSSMIYVAVGIAAAVLLLLFILIIIFVIRRNSAKKESRTRLREEFHGNTLGREITAVDNRGAAFNVNPALDLSDEFDDDTDDDNNFEEERGTINSMDNIYVNNVMMDMDATDLRYIIDRKTNKDEFTTEFGMLPKGLTKRHEEGTKLYNKKKNRFLAIYPYDDTRVVLPLLPGDESSTYINANYIQGYKKPRPYIATQGPLPHTINDFWRMIWHVKARRIVMLTSLAEGGKTKCNQYWPEHDKKMLFSVFQIQNQHEIKRADYIIRIFSMTDSETGEKREILQYHFTSWPDHGVPTVPTLLYFYRLVIMAGVKDEGQLVTHCSAGVGRTGTFLGLDAMIEQARVENKINVFNYVSAMREDRVNMVQTKCQYVFLHHVIFEALITKNTFFTTTRFEEVFAKGVANGSDLEKQLRKEHQNLLMLRKHLTPDMTRAALAPENIIKNRWTDRYLPSDDYRLFLTTPVKGTTSYINAVTVPSILESCGYITTQMPLEETVVDFWRMIYGMDVQSIVSADPYVANNGLPDFGIYWPEENEELLVAPFKIRCTNVSMIAEDVLEYNLTFKLQTRNDISEERVVKLFLLNCWSRETLVPKNISSILAVLETVTQRQSSVSNPIVFQCLNGVSRSGLLSAAANVVLRLKADKELDIFSIIRQTQMILPESISTFEQYKFCYDIAIRCLDSMKVYSNL